MEKTWAWWYIPIILAKVGRLNNQASLGKERPYLQNKKSKKG
jgi:hypothetical protein